MGKLVGKAKAKQRAVKENRIRQTKLKSAKKQYQSYTSFDNAKVEQILIENGFIKHFDKKTDKTIYDNENLTIYIFFGEFDKYGRQREMYDRGFSMICCSTKEEYSQTLKLVLGM